MKATDARPRRDSPWPSIPCYPQTLRRCRSALPVAEDCPRSPVRKPALQDHRHPAADAPPQPQGDHHSPSLAPHPPSPPPHDPPPNPPHTPPTTPHLPPPS